MIIDCHTHLGRNEHVNTRVHELLSSMDQAGIDKSFVFAGDMNNYPTYDMLAEIDPHRDRLYGVASWNYNFSIVKDCINYGGWALGTPQETIYGKLYKAKQIVAVKFYTGYDYYMPGDDRTRRALRELEGYGCPVIFHSGDCLNSCKGAKLKYAHPLHIDEVAVDYPRMNFIIAHMGFPWHRDAAEVCYKNSNVYADISGFVYGNFTGEDQYKFGKVLEEFLDIAPRDKLLFGTDWPISNQASYHDALDWLSHSSTKHSESFTPQFMTQNTIKAFKL